MELAREEAIQACEFKKLEKREIALKLKEDVFI